MAARKTKLTAETINKICEAREIGSTYEIAALYAGIAHSLLSLWLKVAREWRDADKPPESKTYRRNKTLFMELLTRIEAADAAAAIGWMQVIDKAASNDPNWAWKQLQHRYPDFALTQKTDLTTGGEKITGVITIIEHDDKA